MKEINVQKGNNFEDEVASLLKLMGYQIFRNVILCGTQTDIVAYKPDKYNNLKLIVECGDRENNIGIDTIKEKASILLSLGNIDGYMYKLMYVTKYGFTAEAKAYADSNPQITLTTFRELEKNIVDFAPYENWFIYNYENSLGIFNEGSLINNFIDLSAVDSSQNHIQSISEEFSRWSEDTQNNLLFVLGEYGSGKTSFARHVSYNLLKSGSAKLPILINLRDNKDAFNLRQIITDNLINIYGVNLSSFQAFERIASNGNIIMILDGFDEMVEKSDSFTIMNSFKQIFILSNLNTKILLTCRTNFFNKHGEIIDLFKKYSISLSESTEDGKTSLAKIEFEKQGKIIHIEKLSEQQVLNYIRKRFLTEADEILKQIKSIHDLSDLSTRPVLLEMILRSLPELHKEKMTINSASLYEHYTNKWSNRDEWRTKLPLEFRQMFCEVLSWHLFNKNKDSIEYDFLKLIIDETVYGLSDRGDEQQIFHNDIKTCSFLIRSGFTDEFRFAHKSFLEFFVAKKIVTDLAENRGIKESKNVQIDEFNKKTNGLLSFDYYTLKPHHFEIRLSMFERSNQFYGMELSNYFKASFLNKFEFKSPNNIGTLGSYLKTKMDVNLNTRHANIENLISEEIATFTLEIIYNRGIELVDLLGSAKEIDDQNLICDLIKKSKSIDAVKFNLKKLMGFQGERRQFLLTSIAINGLNFPDYFFNEVFPKIKVELTESYIKCILFEIAAIGERYSIFLAEYLKNEASDIITKLICYYGLRDCYQAEKLNIELENLIKELVLSKQPNKDALAVELMIETGIRVKSSVEMLINIINDNNTTKIEQRRATELLVSFYSPKQWQTLRAIEGKIKSESAKKIIRSAEKRLRDITSKDNNKQSYSNTMRQELWKLI